MSIKITGTGSYIPLLTKKNDDFLNAKFLNLDGSDFKVSNDVIIKKIAQSLWRFSEEFKNCSLSTTKPEKDENIFFPNVANDAIRA